MIQTTDTCNRIGRERYKLDNKWLCIGANMHADDDIDRGVLAYSRPLRVDLEDRAVLLR